MIGVDDIEVALVGWIHEVLSDVTGLTAFRGRFAGPVPVAPSVRIMVLSDTADATPGRRGVLIDGDAFDRITQQRTATVSLQVQQDTRSRELAERLQMEIAGEAARSLALDDGISIVDVVAVTDVSFRAPGTQAMTRATSLDLRVAYTRTTSDRATTQATTLRIADLTMQDGDDTRTETFTAP